MPYPSAFYTTLSGSERWRASVAPERTVSISFSPSLFRSGYCTTTASVAGFMPRTYSGEGAYSGLGAAPPLQQPFIITAGPDGTANTTVPSRAIQGETVTATMDRVASDAVVASC